jgi:hypothetical protein
MSAEQQRLLVWIIVGYLVGKTLTKPRPQEPEEGWFV